MDETSAVVMMLGLLFTLAVAGYVALALQIPPGLWHRCPACRGRKLTRTGNRRRNRAKIYLRHAHRTFTATEHEYRCETCGEQSWV